MIAFPPPPSADRQMEDIRKAMHEMHRTLFKWYRAAENMTERTHSPLNEVDTALSGIRNEVTNIRNSFIDTIGKFPSQFVWLSLLLLLDLLIWTIAIFLIVKIVEGVREIGRRRRILREDENEQKFVEEGRRTKNDIKNGAGECLGQSSEMTVGQFEQITGDEFGFCPPSSSQHFPEIALPTQTKKLPRGILKSAPKNNSQKETIKKETRRNLPTEKALFEAKEGEDEEEMRTALLPKEQIHLNKS